MRKCKLFQLTDSTNMDPNVNLPGLCTSFVALGSSQLIREAPSYASILTTKYMSTFCGPNTTNKCSSCLSLREMRNLKTCFLKFWDFPRKNVADTCVAAHADTKITIKKSSLLSASSVRYSIITPTHELLIFWTESDNRVKKTRLSPIFNSLCARWKYPDQHHSPSELMKSNSSIWPSNSTMIKNW